MKIDNLKDLQNVIKACRKLGVQSIRIGDVELHLGAEPVRPSVQANSRSDITRAPLATNPGIITEDTQIITDELTPEQLLFYSSDIESIQDQQ